MIKIKNVYVDGFEAAIRGMRNPMNSWDRSDSWFSSVCGSCPLFDDSSCFEEITQAHGVCFKIGENDLDLMCRLFKAGSDHRKFMRFINVSFDVTSNHFWWAEFDTYKVGTVRNSCSKMHKIHVKPFTKDDFSTDGIDKLNDEYLNAHFNTTIDMLEHLRREFNKNQDFRYWRAMLELLPMGYNIKATIQCNYEVLANIYHSRRCHKLAEWNDFRKWIESLPYFLEIVGSELK